MIRVNKDYVIDVDATSYTAKLDRHKKDKKGEDTYSLVGYYSCIENAIAGIIKDMNVRGLQEDMDLVEALKVIQENNRQFEEILNKAIE